MVIMVLLVRRQNKPPPESEIPPPHHPGSQSQLLSCPLPSELQFSHFGPKGAGATGGPRPSGRQGQHGATGAPGRAPPPAPAPPRPARLPRARTRRQRPRQGRSARRWRWRWQQLDAGHYGGRRAPRLRAQDQQVARPQSALPATPRVRAPPRVGPAQPRRGAPQ